MTNHLPALPSADLDRLRQIDPQELVLACVAFDGGATAQTMARRLKPWGIAAQQVSQQLEALARAGLAEAAGARWLVTQAGLAQAARRFDLEAEAHWPAFAERQFSALALGLDPAQPAVCAYLSQARNLYAAVLAALFDLAEPAALPGLSGMRAALTWRIAAARCPDLLPAQAPGGMSGPNDAITRALYVRFCGLTRGSVDQATPALLRRSLPGPIGAGTGGLRRALVSAAVRSDAGPAPGRVNREVPQMTSHPSAASAVQSEDFAATVAALARRLRTPKTRGGYFTGAQVAIAQVYDAYAAECETAMTLDEFKARLWAAVRDGAGFHLTRLDIPGLMEEALRKRSATPTRAGDVVHFVVAD